MAASPGHPGAPYYASIGDRLGRAYLRYSFTKGSGQEVDFLLDLLDLEEGARVLDVGCGPGRHAVPLAESGLQVVGVDVSRRFLDIAAETARAAGVSMSLFEVDARGMPFDDEFDAAISICQGAFGVMGKDDALVLRRMAEATKRGGWVVVTVASAYFEARMDREEASFDPDTGIVHEKTTIKDEEQGEHEVDLWTGVYTPRELRLLALGVGLVPEAVYSVEPGNFARRPPDLDHPELMLVAKRSSPGA
jgi:SAM-dependent methyltransferase